MNHRKISKVVSLLCISSILVVSIASIFSTVYHNEIFAEPQEESYDQSDNKITNSSEKPWRVPSKMSVNDIMLKVQVQNKDGQMEYDTFTSFKQTAGFKSESQAPTFTLKGLVGPEKHYLYEMVDYSYVMNSALPNHDYRANKFIIYLEYNGIPVRTFEYSNCKITNYFIETLDDGISTYQEDQGMGVAFVDNFEFVCNSYMPHNNYYAMIEKQDRMEKKSHQTAREVEVKK